MKHILFCVVLVGSHALETKVPKKSKSQQLLDAAAKSDTAKMSVLLKNKSLLNDRDADGKTVLHRALESKKESAAMHLIAKGADINARDNADNTPLSLARKHNLKRVTNSLERKFISGSHYDKSFQNHDKHFIILIASYNNAEWFKRNLDSVVHQHYKKYTVIYMDDMSTDGTADLVERYIKERKLEKQFILIKNPEKRYCLGNYLFAIERFCHDNCVLVTLDGDDWFNDNYVLSYLNSIYKTKNVWLTYGESIVYPQNKKTPHCRPISPTVIKNHQFRNMLRLRVENWPVHHLRSFYSWLFRNIQYADFLDENGEIFKYVEDVAFMTPMIEMAGPRHKYISKPLYVYNFQNPIGTQRRFGTKTLQDKFRIVVAKPPYDEL